MYRSTVNEFKPKDWTKLTGVKSFARQLKADKSYFRDERIVNTLVKNDIDTAQKFDDALSQYHGW